MAQSSRSARARARSAWEQPTSAEAFNLIDTLASLADPRVDVDDDPELETLFEQDQADRADDRLAEGSGTRDRDRRVRGMAKLAAGQVCSARDYFHLAMLLQHSGLAEHYHLAHELALRSSAAGFPPATWLAAAALDRWLMHAGLPQKYGTQYCLVNDRWRLYRTDPSTTDDERRRWNVPPLSLAWERAEEMNRERPVDALS